MSVIEMLRRPSTAFHLLKPSTISDTQKPAQLTVTACQTDDGPDSDRSGYVIPRAWTAFSAPVRGLLNVNFALSNRFSFDATRTIQLSLPAFSRIED